jgi:hypothetical protein
MGCYCAIAQEFTLQKLAGTTITTTTTAGKTTYRLTEAINSQAGLITNLYPLDLTTNFELNFDLYFGSKDGADGIGLLFSNSCTPKLEPGNGLAVAGTPNSLIVEFDTYNNGNGNGSYDIQDDHITIFRNGVLDQANSLTSPTPLPNIEDDKFHTVKITWEYFSPDFQTLTVYFDDNVTEKVSSTRNHIADSFAGQTNVFYSFGATTGGEDNEHRVRVNSNSTIYNVCAGGQTTLLAPALGSNYIWSQGGSTTNSNTFTPTSQGTVGCNYIDNCGKPQTVNFTINLLTAIATPRIVIPIPAICSGTNSSFRVAGTSGLELEYNINGTTGTAIIDVSGSVVIPVINPQINQTLTITKVSNTSCSNTVNILPRTMVVNPIPTTSPITTN